MSYYGFSAVESYTLDEISPDFVTLAEALRRVTVLDAKGRFDLSTVVKEKQGEEGLDFSDYYTCGAVCCVVGMACLEPTFPSKGWFINIHLMMEHPHHGDYSDSSYDRVGSFIFNVGRNDAYVLFSPRSKSDGSDEADMTDLEAFQHRLQEFFEHHDRPWPADIPKI